MTFWNMPIRFIFSFLFFPFAFQTSFFSFPPFLSLFSSLKGEGKKELSIYLRICMCYMLVHIISFNHKSTLTWLLFIPIAVPKRLCDRVIGMLRNCLGPLYFLIHYYLPTLPTHVSFNIFVHCFGPFM